MDVITLCRFVCSHMRRFPTLPPETSLKELENQGHNNMRDSKLAFTHSTYAPISVFKVLSEVGVFIQTFASLLVEEDVIIKRTSAIRFDETVR